MRLLGNLVFFFFVCERMCRIVSSPHQHRSLTSAFAVLPKTKFHFHGPNELATMDGFLLCQLTVEWNTIWQRMTEIMFPLEWNVDVAWDMPKTLSSFSRNIFRFVHFEMKISAICEKWWQNSSFRANRFLFGCCRMTETMTFNSHQLTSLWFNHTPLKLPNWFRCICSKSFRFFWCARAHTRLTTNSNEILVKTLLVFRFPIVWISNFVAQTVRWVRRIEQMNANCSSSCTHTHTHTFHSWRLLCLRLLSFLHSTPTTTSATSLNCRFYYCIKHSSISTNFIVFTFRLLSTIRFTSCPLSAVVAVVLVVCVCLSEIQIFRQQNH